MPRRKNDESVVEPEKKKRPRKKKASPPPPCWAVCSALLSDESHDYVRICLGNVFVTQVELERMSAINTEGVE